MALSRVRALRKIKVYSPTSEHRTRFAREMETKIEVEIEPVGRPEDAAKGSDIISTATNSMEPVVRAGWLEEGMHLTSVTNHEFDELAYSRMNIIVANTRLRSTNHYPQEMATRLPPFIRAYWEGIKVSRPEEATDLGDLVAGKIRGRSNDREITFYGSVGGGGGLGIQFAATAKRVLEFARKKERARNCRSNGFCRISIRRHGHERQV
jgi:ornithine cyclodeaminase/alanine dehydrogenase-like protein (mu-crystallin family)